MNINGYSNDNLHQGDVRITGDLQVDGSLEINELEVNELKIDGYTLPTSAGTDGQVIAMNADNTTTSFKDVFSGTANLFINRLYATEPNANFPQGGAAQPIYLQREGSATFSPDEVQPGFGFIKVKGRGFFNIDAPPTTITSLQCLGEWGLNFNGIQFNFSSQFIYTGPNPTSPLIQGWWDIEIVIKSASTAGNLEITYILANSNGRDTGGGSYDINVPAVRSSIRTVGTITTPIPASNFAIFGTYANKSTSADTTCDAVITEYTMDLMSSSSNVVATSETLTTDHTLLSNLTLGDAGHSQFALLAGRNGGQILSGGTTNLHDLKLKSHTAGLDNVVVKDLNTEFKKNIDMDSNNIINANQITKTTPSGGNLEVKNNDGALILSGQGLLGNIQLTTPNNVIANCNLFESLALVNLFNANIVMNGNQIQQATAVTSTGTLECNATADLRLIGDTVDMAATNAITHAIGAVPKLTIDGVETTTFADFNMASNDLKDALNIIDPSTNNKINMNDAGFLNGINISSNGNPLIIQELSTGNNIGITSSSGGLVVNNGPLNIRNTDGANNLSLLKDNGGNIRMNVNGGGVVIIENTDLDMNNNNIINVAGINNLTAVGGVYAGTSNGTLINNTTEQSVLPASGVGSLTIPANTFQVGDSFHCVVAGDCSLENKDEIQIKLKENGNILAQTPVFEVEDANAGGNAFEIEIDFTIRSIGAVGSIATNFDFTYNKDGTDSKDFRGTRAMDVQPIDTTVSSTLEITVQFPTNAASSLQTRLFRLQKVY